MRMLRNAAWRHVAFAVAALLAAPVARAQAQQFTAKFGTATLADAQNVWCDDYAAMLEKDSGGRIKATVYPDSQLGSIPRMIEQVQFNAAQLFTGPPEFLYGVDPRFQLLTAPGLFKSLEQANHVLQDPEFSSQFLAMGEGKGLVGVGLFLSAPEAFAMRMPVHNIAGFAGLKIRVLASPMQTEQIRALKGTPVPMALGEVMPALQQGALDGVMADAPVFTPMKFMSVAKYLVETEQAMVTSIAVVSRKWLQSLPPDLQKIVIEDGRKESAAIYPKSMQLLNVSFSDWEKGGGQVIHFDQAEHDKLLAMLSPIAENVASQDPKVLPMYRMLQDALKRADEAMKQ
jgi:TRAP-type transport system periplasmic protein